MSLQQRSLTVRMGGPGVKTREESLNGRKHIVVPVIALVEGVIHAMNAKNAEFVSADEFSRAPQGWNGRPLFSGHPIMDGQPVSGNTPQVLEQKSIGQIFNTNSANKKLKTEAWIDEEKSNAVDPTVLERVAEGTPIEVSVGVFVETDDEPGIYQGKRYTGSWHDIVPDHLALLAEGDEGACSRKMGCGVRAANKGNQPMELLDLDSFKTLRNIPQSERDKMPAEDFAGPNRTFPISEPEDVDAAAHSLGRAKTDAAGRAKIKSKIISIAYRKGKEFVAQLPEDWKKKKDQKNSGSFLSRISSAVAEAIRGAGVSTTESDTDVRQELVEALREQEPGLLCIEAVYTDRVIYSVYSGGGVCCYQRTYDDSYVVGSDRVEVEPVTTWIPVASDDTPGDGVTAAEGKRNSKTDQEKIQAMHDHAVALGAACDPKMASARVAGKPCACGGSHPEAQNHPENRTMNKTELTKFLETATEDQIKALSAVAEGKNPETPAAPAAAVVAPVAAAAAPAPKTIEEAIASVPEQFRGALTAGHKVAQDRKAATIKTLKDTGRCDVSDEKLNGMTQEELDSLVKLAGTVRAAVDFGGAGAPAAKPAGSEQKDAPAAPNMAERIAASRKAGK
jgi:hypothetical protein